MYKTLNKLKVKFQGKDIGILSYDGHEYEFQYLPDFQHLKLGALPGITPPKAHSTVLWAYFLSRIPSYNSPIFNRLVTEYELDDIEKNDIMYLLATIGSKVITDPFELEPMP
jgi:hypothetical protein